MDVTRAAQGVEAAAQADVAEPVLSRAIITVQMDARPDVQMLAGRVVQVIAEADVKDAKDAVHHVEVNVNTDVQ